jgi:glycosyltransferase involved in cell wall biosynthesis
MSYRVLLKTALTPFTGYGMDGLGLAVALGNAGFDVTLSPTVVEPPLPAPVAALLTRPIEPMYDLVLNHADPASLGLSDGERRAGHKTMAWSMWEFRKMPDHFNEPFGPPDYFRNLKERLATYDVLGIYDEISREALLPYVTPDTTEVIKLQGGYWSDPWLADPRDRDWSGTFRFCMHGALHDRKNPFAAIEAFNKLKADYGDDFDAELHLKTNVRVLHPAMEDAYPGIKIHYVTWSEKQLKEFYLACHCLLAPSWGEGKNLPALQAQTTGMPVIATDVGGHAEWLSKDWAYPLNFEWGEHAPGIKSARADVNHLADLMWHVYNHRDEARLKGEKASHIIPSMLDWAKVIDRLKAQLHL